MLRETERDFFNIINFQVVMSGNGIAAFFLWKWHMQCNIRANGRSPQQQQ